jgi:hypothetical protein
MRQLCLPWKKQGEQKAAQTGVLRNCAPWPSYANSVNTHNFSQTHLKTAYFSLNMSRIKP